MGCTHLDVKMVAFLGAEIEHPAVPSKGVVWCKRCGALGHVDYPVVVEFSVGNKAANPTDVKVVAGSLSPRLDQGAIEAVKAMVMSSNCNSGRYRLKLSFQLEQ